MSKEKITVKEIEAALSAYDDHGWTIKVCSDCAQILWNTALTHLHEAPDGDTFHSIETIEVVRRSRLTEEQAEAARQKQAGMAEYERAEQLRRDLRKAEKRLTEEENERTIERGIMKARLTEAQRRLTVLRQTTLARLCEERDAANTRADKAEALLSELREALEEISEVGGEYPEGNFRYASEHVARARKALAALASLQPDTGEEA